MGKRNLSKLHELILYVVTQYRDDAPFGIIRLGGVLFAADFARYRHKRESITGSVYVATPHGPVPEGLQEIIEEMSKQGWLKSEVAADNGEHPSQRLIALRKPNLEFFTPDEITFIDGIIAEQRVGLGERFSHQFLGWQAIPHGKRIPYGTALLSKPTLTPDEVAFGLAISEQLAAQRER